MDFSKIKLLSFDCYGTLVDWKKSVLDILEPFFSGLGSDVSRERLFALFLQEDRKQISGLYQSYKEILANILAGIAGDIGIALEPSDRYLLTDNFEQWLPFPDTLESLNKLKEQFSLAIISNVDNELFSITNNSLEIDFDFVITAMQLKSYKPAELNFNAALDKFGLDKRQVLHVAQSIHHDIIPSNRLQWNNVWINRYDEPERTDPAEFPDLEVPDLASLARILDLEFND